MDQTQKTGAGVVIRSAEPHDAAAISALLGQLGTFEGTLQLPDTPVAARIEFLQRMGATSTAFRWRGCIRRRRSSRGRTAAARRSAG